LINSTAQLYTAGKEIADGRYMREEEKLYARTELISPRLQPPPWSEDIGACMAAKVDHQSFACRR
jgi:hypothetical protein